MQPAGFLPYHQEIGKPVDLTPPTPRRREPAVQAGLQKYPEVRSPGTIHPPTALGGMRVPGRAVSTSCLAAPNRPRIATQPWCRTLSTTVLGPGWRRRNRVPRNPGAPSEEHDALARQRLFSPATPLFAAARTPWLPCDFRLTGRPRPRFTSPQSEISNHAFGFRFFGQEEGERDSWPGPCFRSQNP